MSKPFSSVQLLCKLQIDAAIIIASRMIVMMITVTKIYWVLIMCQASSTLCTGVSIVNKIKVISRRLHSAY